MIRFTDKHGWALLALLTTIKFIALFYAYPSDSKLIATARWSFLPVLSFCMGMEAGAADWKRWRRLHPREPF